MKDVKLSQVFIVIQRIVDIPRENIDVQFFPSLEDWEGMGLRLRARIWGETVDHREYPSTWWDAFKLRWFPPWLRRKFPVCVTVLDAKALYPNVSMPDKLSKIVIDESKDFSI